MKTKREPSTKTYIIATVVSVVVLVLLFLVGFMISNQKAAEAENKKRLEVEAMKAEVYEKYPMPQRPTVPKPPARNLINEGWEETEIVDEFGDVEEMGYVYVTSGTFSNSATVDEEMTVKVVITKKWVRVQFFEYNNPPHSPLSYEEGKKGFIRLKDSTVRTHFIYSSNQGLYALPSGETREFYEFVKTDKTASVVVSSSDFGKGSVPSVYKFTLKGIGNIEQREAQLKREKAEFDEKMKEWRKNEEAYKEALAERDRQIKRDLEALGIEG